MKHFFVKLTLLVLMTLCLASDVKGQNYYVRQGATGNGSDWNNAYGNLPTSLVRGATYYIASGNYGFYQFDDAASGTSIITIKKATVLDHGISTGWNDSYGNGSAVWTGWEISRPYYTFEGNVRNPDWKGGYGFRVATGGQYGINLFVGASSTAQFIVIRNTEVQGRGLDNSSHDDGIYSPQGCNNVKLQNVYIHDVGRAPILTGFSLNWLLEYSVIARNSSDPVYHSEGWASSADSNMVIRYNVFEDIEGTGYIVCLNRGSGANTCSNWEIYGNVFMYSEGNPYNREGVGDGAIAVINQQVAQNWKIYNNSFINIGQGPVGIAARVIVGGDGQTGNSSVFVYNNFWWRSDAANNLLNGCSGCESRWNRYDGTTHYTEQNQQENLTADTSTFVNYLAKDFRLVSGTFSGNPLSSPYDLDLNNNQRGSDGVWDRGAFEFGGTNVVIVITNPPVVITNPPVVVTNPPVVVVTNLPSPTNVFPVVVLTSPANNSFFTNNSSIQLSAIASDADGSIVSVEFYNSASRIGILTAPPYSLTWPNLSQGTYRIFAKVYDDKGASAVAGPNIVVVTNQIPVIGGCTNTLYITNNVISYVDRYVTNTVTITLPPIYYTNYVDKYVTNTITITLPPVIVTNFVPVIPDVYTTTSTLDKTNNTLDIFVRFK